VSGNEIKNPVLTVYVPTPTFGIQVFSDRCKIQFLINMLIITLIGRLLYKSCKAIAATIYKLSSVWKHCCGSHF